MVQNKRPYQAPQVFEYGPIGDHTFHTPGGTKRCHTECHIDKWGELGSSHHPAS